MPEPDEALVVIPLPLDAGGVTYVVAKLVEEGGEPFAEAIAPAPGRPSFAPPRRVALSRYSLGRIRPGAVGRPDLYLYEGMILPPHSRSESPNAPHA